MKIILTVIALLISISISTKMSYGQQKNYDITISGVNYSLTQIEIDDLFDELELFKADTLSVTDIYNRAIEKGYKPAIQGLSSKDSTGKSFLILNSPLNSYICKNTVDTPTTEIRVVDFYDNNILITLLKKSE